MAADGINFADMLAMQASDLADRYTSCGFCLDVCHVFPMTKAASKAGSKRTIEAIIGLLKTDQVADEAYDMARMSTRSTRGVETRNRSSVTRGAA